MRGGARLEWVVAIGALRCANPNGVVSSDFLEGRWAAAGPTGDEFGTTGFGAWTAHAEQALPTVSAPVWGGALAQRLKMALGKKTPTSLSGTCLTMLTRGGFSVITTYNSSNQIATMGACNSNGFQAIQKTNFYRISSDVRIFRDMWVRIFFVALTVIPRLQSVLRLSAWQSNILLKPTTPASRTSFVSNGVRLSK